MLQVIIPEREFFDEELQEFISIKSETFQIEHSLVSLAKWEAKWHKPFLSKQEKTDEETLDYIRCMTITQNVKESVYSNLPQETIVQISNYIEAPMTATWFNDEIGGVKNNEIVTAEIIYYWMIEHKIPIEFQKWHLKRLITLIRVCNIKNRPPTKMNKKEMLAQRKALNDARRNKLNSKG